MMLALMDFLPDYCPKCGVKHAPWSAYGREDWHAGASHQCLSCRLMYARADTDAMLEAADKSNSDLSRYV
jgi:hypothetical protein